MLYQEVTIAKSPKYRNTRKPGIVGCLDVDIAVTNIDSLLRPYA